MYGSIASRVEGSSHESGRCTMRLATTTSSSGGQLVLGVRAGARRRASAVCVDRSNCTCSERIPGVTSIGAKLRWSSSHAPERVGAEPQVEVERHRAVLDEHGAVALGAVGDLRGVVVRGTGGEHGRGGAIAAPTRTRACARRQLAARRGRPARASARSTGTKRTRVARRQLAELPAVVGDDRDRAREAAEARAVGPEQDRHVAGEVDRADGVRRVVHVRRVEPGFAAVGAGPLHRRPDQPHAGARRVVVHLPRRWRRTRRCPSAVTKSGAACGPSSTASSHSVRERGHRPGSIAGVAGSRRAAAPCRRARGAARRRCAARGHRGRRSRRG